VKLRYFQMSLVYMIYYMIYDIFLKLKLGCHPVATQLQFNTNNTQNDTKKIIHRTTLFGRVRTVPRLCDLYPGICLKTEENARKNLRQGSRRAPAGTMKIHKYIYHRSPFNTPLNKLSIFLMLPMTQILSRFHGILL
jgi:hypothetical protein